MSYSDDTIPSGPDPFVTVRRFNNLFELDTARSVLDGAGIEARCFDDMTVQMDWIYANAIGGARLQVRASRVEDAAELLDAALGAARPEVVREISGRIRRRMLCMFPFVVVPAIVALLAPPPGGAPAAALVVVVGLALSFLVAILWHHPGHHPGQHPETNPPSHGNDD